MAHTNDCMCSEMLNHGLNYGLFLSPFQIDQIHDKNLGFYRNSLLNVFRRKKRGFYTILDFRFLHFTWNTSSYSPFLSGQMAVLSIFFQMLIVLGMYTFDAVCWFKINMPFVYQFQEFSQKKYVTWTAHSLMIICPKVILPSEGSTTRQIFRKPK